MTRGLYREESLDKLSSPEQLDEYVKVTNPGVFIIVAAFFSIFAAVLVWAFTGNISDSISIKGIVFPERGVSSVIHSAEGMVSDVHVKKGEYVEAGEVIAIVPQDDIIEKIKDLRAGNAPQEEIDEAMEEYNSKSKIVAPVSGIVLDVIQTGEMVGGNKVVAKIIQQDIYTNAKEIIGYIRMADSKKIRIGMEAQVSPEFAPREEFGYMQGFITKIGEYPVTQEDIENSLGIVQFSRDILPEENSVEVRISLTVDPDSKNLIKWSNKKGSNLQVDIGTVCNILIVDKTRRPIDLFLK
ncbi:MAG: HlyD family efflux transporter periplasmic adaptor subunit [Clostridiaceae bacterium]|nr:HlyD family efflux transporter periplasmic adaptor subunit [Clostridiaceae bacterium]